MNWAHSVCLSLSEQIVGGVFSEREEIHTEKFILFFECYNGVNLPWPETFPANSYPRIAQTSDLGHVLLKESGPEWGNLKAGRARENMGPVDVWRPIM